MNKKTDYIDSTEKQKNDAQLNHWKHRQRLQDFNNTQAWQNLEK